MDRTRNEAFSAIDRLYGPEQAPHVKSLFDAERPADVHSWLRQVHAAIPPVGPEAASRMPSREEAAAMTPAQLEAHYAALVKREGNPFAIARGGPGEAPDLGAVAHAGEMLNRATAARRQPEAGSPLALDEVDIATMSDSEKVEHYENWRARHGNPLAALARRLRGR